MLAAAAMTAAVESKRPLVLSVAMRPLVLLVAMKWLAEAAAGEVWTTAVVELGPAVEQRVVRDDRVRVSGRGHMVARRTPSQSNIDSRYLA